MILLQSYLYTYSLLSGVNFQVISLSTYALSIMMLPMVETFFRTPVAELSLSPSHFLNVFNILKSSPLLRQTF